MSGFQSQQTSFFARKSFQSLLFLLPHLLSSCQHSQYRPNCPWRWPKRTFCLVAANSAQCEFSILQQKIHLHRAEDDHSLCRLLHGLVAECKIFGPFVWQILSKHFLPPLMAAVVIGALWWDWSTDCLINRIKKRHLKVDAYAHTCTINGGKHIIRNLKMFPPKRERWN